MSFFSALFSCCCGASDTLDEKRAQARSEADARHARIANLYAENNRDHEPFPSDPLANSAASPLAFPPPSYADISRDRQIISPTAPQEKSPRSIAYLAAQSQMQTRPQTQLQTQLHPQYQSPPINYMHMPNHAQPAALTTRPHSNSLSNSITMPTSTSIPASSRPSSIISVPSTRLSDLTSMHTGTTRRTHVNVLHYDGDSDGDADSGFYGSSSRSYQDQSAPPSYYAGSDYGDHERNETPTPFVSALGTLNQHPVMRDGWLERIMQMRMERESGRDGDSDGDDDVPISESHRHESERELAS